MTDNYDIWLAEDMRRERWRESRPVCVVCGEHVQDPEIYNTARGLMCEDCATAEAEKLADEYKTDIMNDWRKHTEDYCD